MRPIPKKLLIHEVTLYRRVSDDRWGKVQLDGGTLLTRVRLEPSSKIVRDKSGAEIQLEAAFFYDCRNSRPKGFEFREDDIILFHGQKHRVKVVESLYDEKVLHHYEMGLVKYA